MTTNFEASREGHHDSPVVVYSSVLYCAPLTYQHLSISLLSVSTRTPIMSVYTQLMYQWLNECATTTAPTTNQVTSQYYGGSNVVDIDDATRAQVVQCLTATGQKIRDMDTHHTWTVREFEDYVFDTVKMYTHVDLRNLRVTDPLLRMVDGILSKIVTSRRTNKSPARKPQHRQHQQRSQRSGASRSHHASRNNHH
jgi:hypothetical protein